MALLARAHLLAGRMGDAREAAETAVQRGPADAGAWFALGGVEHACGNLDKAEAALSKAIQLDPDGDAPILLRARLRQEQNRHAEALDDYFHFLLRRPDHPKGLGGRGAAYACLGRHEAALRDLDAALETFPNDPWLRYHRALALAGLNKHQDALAELGRATALDPRNAAPWALNARVLDALGRRDEARASVQAALQRNPNFQPAKDLARQLGL